MEEHSHVAGDSTQPAGPRVGTLHAIPPTMVRTLDLENSMTVDVLYNGHLANRGKWPLWGVVQYFHLKKIAYCSTTVNNYWWSPPSSGCYCQGLICFWNVYQIETKLNHIGGWRMFLFPRYPWSLDVTDTIVFPLASATASATTTEASISCSFCQSNYTRSAPSFCVSTLYIVVQVVIKFQKFQNAVTWWSWKCVWVPFIARVASVHHGEISTSISARKRNSFLFLVLILITLLLCLFH